MSVTIQKKGKVVKKKAKVLKHKPSELKKLVDKLGDVYLVLSPAQDIVKAQKKLWTPLFSEIQTGVDETNKESANASVQTKKYLAQFTPHGNSTLLTDSHKCFEMLESVKKGLAWELMGFGIAELRSYLTPDQFDAVTTTKRTTNRSVAITCLEDED